MLLRRSLAGAYWAVSRYRLESEPAPDRPAVLIGAPHTSNWDFVIMLMITWRLGFSPKWLGKHTLFKRPYGRLMRALGGIPVDRRQPIGVVEEIVARVKAGEQFMLVVTPEGTRGRGTYWKSGFYRIARQTGMPLVLGYVDSSTRTAGLGPTLELTGDVRRDMDAVRAFYADKRGIRPEDFTPPLLREEEALPPSPGASASPATP